MQDWSDRVEVQKTPGAVNYKALTGTPEFLDKHVTYKFTYTIDFPGAVALADYEDFVATSKARFEEQLRYLFKE